MYLDIFYDTICPWCVIGKKRLEEALKSRSHISLKPRWRPFLLNPSMGKNGMDRQTYLHAKFGSPQRAEHVYGMIYQAGRDNGIDFRFDKITKTPNSVMSHRLVFFAEKFQLEEKTVDQIFQAFFFEGQDIGELETLLLIAQKVGLPDDEVLAYLQSDEDIKTVYECDAQARELGVNGVPAFLARDRFVLSGAHEATVLGKFIETAWNS